MGLLFDSIRRLVMDGRYVVGQHAVERLDERSILEWQVVDGIDASTLVIERPNDEPNPSVVVREVLPDGTDIRAVWSHIASADVAKLVTVYFIED